MIAKCQRNVKREMAKLIFNCAIFFGGINDICSYLLREKYENIMY